MLPVDPDEETCGPEDQGVESSDDYVRYAPSIEIDMRTEIKAIGIHVHHLEFCGYDCLATTVINRRTGLQSSVYIVYLVLICNVCFR